MCGICGIVDFSGGDIDTVSLRSMNAAMAHRGPDDEGYVLIDAHTGGFRSYSGETSAPGVRARLPRLTGEASTEGASIGLAHRRFSIVDLTDAGHQPMFDCSKTCCVVFNGEIYNYLELRDELSREGVTFKTKTDTEVLLEAYRRWGIECLPHLIGMWAFALYDFRKRVLILSRDRLGKRPLYWTKKGTKIHFASEIKALLAVPEVSARRAVDEQSIYRWLAWGRKDVGTHTCFADISTLGAASWAVADENFPANTCTFWRIPDRRLTERQLPADEAAAVARSVLNDAVTIRMRADVPVGVELSGGMDSSSLTALAAQHCSKLSTFTVAFADPQWNEESFALSVARRYRTNHKVLNSPVGGFWQNILPFTFLEEEPYHSPNLYVNQAIWSQMRAAGTKVSINGAAGDENFAGYGGHFHLYQAENLMRGRFLRYLRGAFGFSSEKHSISALATPFKRIARAALARTPASRLLRPRLSCYRGQTFDADPFPTTLSTSLFDDMTRTLMPYWLRSGDRGHMGIPLEVRAPFLDHRVVEFAFRLPTSYLIREGWHKWILRKAFQGAIPDDVLWRPRKLGFPFPYERFFNENGAIIERVLERCDNPYLDLRRRAVLPVNWRTLSFILWFELFFNGNERLLNDVAEMAPSGNDVQFAGFRPLYVTGWQDGRRRWNNPKR